jgi:hypothetical protein
MQEIVGIELNNGEAKWIPCGTPNVDFYKMESFFFFLILISLNLIKSALFQIVFVSRMS